MVKRDITETIYEYDSEGKLTRKTVTETHEEEEDKITTSSYQTYPRDITLNNIDGVTVIPCNNIAGKNDNVTISNGI